MQQSLRQYDRNLESFQSSIETPASVQIEITTGRARNRLRAVHHPVYFIGSAADCDMVLGDDRFPPIYAFLLVRQRGVIVRHLGHGPDLHISGRPIQRAVVSESVRIHAGPFSFTLHVSPNVDSRTPRLRVHKSTVRSPNIRLQDLIQRASQLLADIERQAQVGNISPQIYVVAGRARQTTWSLKVSTGVPSLDSSSLQWKHLHQ